LRKTLENILNASEISEKVVFIISLYISDTPSGANIRFSKLMESSDKNNLNIRFISTQPFQYKNHIQIVKARGRFNQLIQNTFLQIVLRKNISIFDSPFLIKNKKHFLLIHDPGGLIPNLRRNNYIKSKIYRLILYRTNNFITVSNFTKSYLEQQFKKTKVIASYNGTDKEYVVPKPLNRDIDFLIVSSGEKHKRDEILVEFLQKNYPNKKIKVITNSKNLKDKFPRRSNLIFESNITRSELLTNYANSKFYTNFSEIEGFGIPIIEALTFGCKLYISQIPVYKEITNQYLKESIDISTKIHWIKTDDQGNIFHETGLFEEINKIEGTYSFTAIPKAFRWSNIAKKIEKIQNEIEKP
jgi:glycosyltransferase involved in cell wall biosynthesis